MLRSLDRHVDCPDCRAELRHDGKVHRYVCDTPGCRVLYGIIQVRYIVTPTEEVALPVSHYSSMMERRETLQVIRESASMSGSRRLGAGKPARLASKSGQDA